MNDGKNSIMSEDAPDKRPEKITDPTAKDWYDHGFRFAVNYIYAQLPESSNKKLIQKDFKDVFHQCFGDDMIKDEYFEIFPFYEDTSKYGPGQCPGIDPNTCIACIREELPLLPRKFNVESKITLNAKIGDVNLDDRKPDVESSNTPV